MKKIVIAITLAMSLSACTSHYFLQGKKYDDEASFQAAVENERSAAINHIQPLQAPLTKKRLIVSIPSEPTLYAESLRRYLVAQGKEASGLALDQYRNLAKSNFKLTKMFFEAVQKRGVYPSVTINETQTMVNSLEPSDEYDVMYYSETGVGSGQIFYASSKHGKQIFAYDNSSLSINEKAKAFTDAVQVLAIRE